MSEKISRLRNGLPGALMIFSILLLIVVQVLWLASSWREAREDFRRETNGLFRNTIFAMQDSMVFQNIQAVGADSSFHLGRPSPADSVGPLFERELFIDRTVRRDSTSMIEFFVTEDNKDSAAHLIRPLVRRMRMDKGNKKFIVHLGPDSLRTDSIEVRFREALMSAGLPVSFGVIEIRKTGPGRVRPVRFPEGMLVSEVVPFNPVRYYAVQFKSVEHVLWKAITPQILFCIFLTVLTTGSFYAISRSMRSQRRLMQLKNDFISNMSHELKTPVSTVSVAIEALERFRGLDDPDKTNEYLMMAKSELHRLTLMVDRILQTASPGVRETPGEKTRVNLDEKIREVLDSLKLLFEKRGIAPQYSTQGTDFFLRADQEQLTTLVYNLLDNASKYTREAPAIEILLEDCGDEIVFSVADNGVGIPKRYHKKVFEKFFRVPSGDVHDTRGYGLGLSYVAKVVQQHKGTIRLDSETGQGTSFTVCLPKEPGK